MAAKTAGNRESLAVVLEKGKVLMKQAAVPDRLPHFALLELIVAGVCNTDLELQRGYYNFHGTPGHEFVARVVDCENPLLAGRRVVGDINLGCGKCDFCAAQLGRHCRNRSVLGIVRHPGAFSQFFTLPEANLHLVPGSVPDETAVFVEPLAAACEILDQIHLPAGSEVAVLGDGKLGLLITQVLLAHELNVTLYGHHDKKLEIARKAGARTAIVDELPKAAYPCVVECTGSAAGLASAIQMTRPRGVVVMKSTVHNQVALDMAPVIVNEISLVGSRCGRFEPAIELLENRRVDVTAMISAEFALSEASHAFELAATRGVLKVLLRA